MQDNTIVLLAGEGVLATVGTVSLAVGQLGLAETLFGALIGLIAGHLNGKQASSAA